MKKFIGIMSVLLIFVGASLSYAYTIYPDQYIYQPDPNITVSDLSAEAVFEVSDNPLYDIKITLYNTTTDLNPDDFPAVILLTGLGLNLQDDIIGGAIGNDYFIGLTSYSDGGRYWGYNNDVSSSFFADPAVLDVDNVIATLEAINATTFSPSDPGDVDGPKHGVKSAVEDAPKNYPYFDGSVVIYLELDLGEGQVINDDYFKAIDDGNVVVSFGSPTAVPEPMTLILLGFGLLGLAGIRRK
jgi:hypothetical protein